MRVILFVAIALGGGVATAAELTGVPQIVDGDTLSLGGTTIRLERIDAPELDQVCLNATGDIWPCGTESRDRLAAYIADREVRCTLSGEEPTLRRTRGKTPSLRKILATCYLGDEDLNGWMVQQGWAIPYLRRSFTYAPLEENARAQKRGLWQGAFIAPWNWRGRNNKTAILGGLSVPINAQAKLSGPAATEDPPSPQCTIKGNVTRLRQRVYHMQHQKSYAKVKIDKAAKRWFCTSEQAEEAGWRRALR
jgi:endonuclease YncB( thermonuclease family)